MKLLWFLPSIAAVALTNPVGDPHGISAHVASLSREEAHNNVMKNHPADWIVNSTNLHEYLVANRGSNHTIYIADDQAFVSLALVQYSNKTVAGRESGGCISPYRYTKTYTKQTQQFPGAWNPASSCFYTGNSNAGGTQSLMTSYSVSVQENAGLDVKFIADTLSAVLGITVTQSWSWTYGYTCAVRKHSVVQVWAQSYLAWGWFWSRHCNSCDGCGLEYVNGGATAPAKNPNTGQFFNYGCSTGYNKVQC